MLKAFSLLVLITMVSGCGSEPDTAAPERNSVERRSPALPTKTQPPPEAAAPSELPLRSREAGEASDVLQSYYDAIAARRYDQAWSLRWKGRGDDEASRKAFSDRMKRYADYRANVGQAGPVVEAKGYSYVDVPVQIFGRTVEGEPFSTAGTVTLRRKGGEGWKIYSRD